LGAIAGVALLRAVGFVGTVMGVHMPMTLALGYIGIFATLGLGYFAISRGVIIEPPAFLVNFANTLAERWMRRVMAN
jgi:hypothetical protein